MDDFWRRMKQRKLVQWALAYIAAAFALVQVIDVVAQRFGWPDRLEQALLLVLATGFFVTLVLAWYHGERGEQRVRGTELALLALLLAIGGATVWRFAAVDAPPRAAAAPGAGASPAPARAAAGMPAVDEKSIAVLPFASLSPGQDNAYFADGLSEEIINSLSRVPDLQVAARTSSFAFRGSDRTVPQIAAELHVAAVLEGSVRRAGDRLRITAQLIRAADGFDLWSEDYDRDSSDIIAIQEDVARSIAEAMKTATDPQALAAMQRAGTRSVPAYLAYLRGLALLEQADTDGTLEAGQVGAQAAFDRAIALDPGFVDAYARSADLQWSSLRPTSMGSPDASADYPARLERLRRDLDRAAGLARTSAQRDYYASLWASLDQRHAEARRLMSAYAATYPNDLQGVSYLAEWALYAGDRDDTRRRAEVLAKAPIDWGNTIASPISLLLWARDFPRAEAVAREQLRKYPDSIETLYNVHRALLGNGRVAEAAALLPRLEASGLDDSGKFLVRIRQLCAERRGTEAGRLYASAAAAGRLDGVARWYGLDLLGRHAEAAALLSHLDTPAYFNALAAYLVYPQFDVARFPHFDAVLAAQGIRRPPAREPPFACVPENGAAGSQP
jgi:TolB-like protein